MKLKLTILTIAAALLGVSAAFAAPPAGKGKPTTTPASTNAAHPTVMFVVRGKITAYTAANGATNGSVSLTVSGSNHFVSSTLKGQPLTFVVSSSTKLVGTPTVGHNAVVKWRATKTPATAAPSSAVLQLIDQGAPSSS
jgi:hypothetical protein